MRKNIIHTINKTSSIHFDVRDYNFIVYSRLQDLQEKLKNRIQASIQIEDADPLPTIAEAMDRYYTFEKEQKELMLKERVTTFEVQPWNDKSALPVPFNGSLSFHVKEGLSLQGNGIVFNKNDGALYVAEKKHRGWGRYTEEHGFIGLIQRAQDIDDLIKKIRQRYTEQDE